MCKLVVKVKQNLETQALGFQQVNLFAAVLEGAGSASHFPIFAARLEPDKKTSQ